MTADDEPIRLSLKQEVVCPQDGQHRFALREGLAETTIHRMQREWLDERERELAKARDQIGRKFSEREKTLEQELHQQGEEITNWRNPEATRLSERAQFVRGNGQKAINTRTPIDA